MNAITFVIGVAVTAPAGAREAARAPLPTHFSSEAGYDEADKRPVMPALSGVYAHGVTGTSWDRERDGIACVGTEAEQDRAVKRAGIEGNAEFWLYATGQQGVLLTREVEFNATKPCSSAMTFRYEVERAYVADGYIHSLSVDEEGLISADTSQLKSYNAGEYSSGFARLQSLMSRAKPRRRDRRQGTELIAGTRAACHGTSGIVWSRVCVVKSGPARGMILSAQAGDDERIMFRNVIDELKVDVLLPGVMFEIDRRWRGKD